MGQCCQEPGYWRDVQGRLGPEMRETRLRGAMCCSWEPGKWENSGRDKGSSTDSADGRCEEKTAMAEEGKPCWSSGARRMGAVAARMGRLARGTARFRAVDSAELRIATQG